MPHVETELHMPAVCGYISVLPYAIGKSSKAWCLPVCVYVQLKITGGVLKKVQRL